MDDSAIDDYFDSIQNLYSYNLTAVAENITRKNDEVRIEAMIQFNNLTYPAAYDYANYSNANVCITINYYSCYWIFYLLLDSLTITIIPKMTQSTMLNSVWMQ